MADDLPSGFAYYRTEAHKLLALPHALAEEAEAARAQRQSDEAEARRTAKTQEAERGPDVAAAGPTTPSAEPALSASPAPGFLRVLPRFTELTGPQAEADIRSRTSDDDVRRRLEAVRQRLLELGPDRRVARTADWRAALDRLEAALPNFRDPIGLLRDTLALAEAASGSVRIPPMLLLGPPGIGKTYFSHEVAALLGVPHASIAFDQPTAGSQLRGTDKYWSNTESGILFKLVCLGEVANPVVLLDELDKSALGSNRRELDPLAQLHGALEPQTARCIQDVSTDIEFDASLVGYIATANSLRGIGLPLLSRFEVIDIGAPDAHEAVQVARHVMHSVLERLGLAERVGFDRRCAAVLARMSPRLMQRVAERLVAQALRERRDRVSDEDVWAALGWNETSRLH